MPRPPLSRQLVDDLRREILRGQFVAAGRLPSEAALARRYDVSRPTVREALQVLETEGLIRRRRGRGTFLTSRPAAVTAGIERLESFTETIRRAGFEAKDEVLEIRPVRLLAAVAGMLGRTAGAAGILVRSLRYADGIPVIYCEDIIPGALVGDPRLLERRRERESLLDFFTNDLRIEVRYALLSVAAVRPPRGVRAALALAGRAPLILLRGTAYDGADRPLYASFNYVRSDRYQFTLVRR
ncbi:MAG: GntR family transcriptional regulator [Armatimonadota bacterium]|nr:GntR family transcriptional regulator [Armatimonadota bacterium]MDR7452470.1 GntR family transcriptional regulator [Armatimonadota bacterium]MDR7467322.1 GntR family transcriptional regulator [Armatimonadota bacterium]MDR7494093.1 GntR family transcriptional regulator [Armatimonadota bacterium]MDR7498940.1 GntR family transcriptional regulator [Armatimonadota bacterium]